LSASFTPGPWELHWHGGFALQVRTALDGDVDSDTGEHIVVGGDLIATLSDILPAEANARLIAAAPSLYADAEFLCARVRELEGDLDGDSHAARQFYGHVIPALARMEDALAEARGGHD
jgi:hypothetical protein